jgi:hypothetical protein
MIQFYKDEKVQKQTKIHHVPEPTDTRVQPSKFTQDNGETLDATTLNQTQLLKILNIITFVSLRLIPQFCLTKDNFKLDQDPVAVQALEKYQGFGIEAAERETE